MKILVFLLVTAVPGFAEPTYVLQKDAGKLLSSEVTEASGIAVSPSSENFLWMINDSGGTPEIHLSDTEGGARGSVKISGVKNKDWEDLASFSMNGKSYLLIADTGDNAATRTTVQLLIVREPTLPAEGKSVSGEVPVAWKIAFSYEDGPKDCEAVGVDAEAGKIILVSKRTKIPQVYELPLKPSDGGKKIAKQIGTTGVKAPSLSFIPYRNQPTGMDISKDGNSAVIVTYYGVFLFQKNKGETWATAFGRKPMTIGSHRLAQAESVAFSNDAKKIFCVSEGINSPIVRFDLQE